MRELGLALAALATLAAGAAKAEEAAPAVPRPCHDYKALVTALDKRYGEAPVSLGMQNNGHALQVFASAESGSWTVLSVAPDGTGCIVAAGRHWQTRKPGTSDPAA
ncbi:MAG: hypothetical protein H6852_03355 [Geminicoccaceae bacterium]|jgi:hypothetical protein|nr:hypothetical protein [Geminicoccaceae bacterium]MCB9966662.1 hypothetical protein [Geminicoccaceae bacterium]HRY25403.1 hypothetical protein [Geminicoccaceae bacterium]